MNTKEVNISISVHLLLVFSNRPSLFPRDTYSVAKLANFLQFTAINADFFNVSEHILAIFWRIV